MNHIYHPVTGLRDKYDKLKLLNAERWTNRMSNELGRLASGVGYRKKSGTETIFFVPKDQVPVGRKETCANAVWYYILLKDDP